MTNRSMPPGIIIPELAYADVPAAAAWLCRAFGFQERLRIGTHRCQLVLGGTALVVIEGSPPADGGPLTHGILLHVDNVDARYAQAIQNGARSLRPPETHPYGERQCTVVDLGGHRWTFSQSVADIAPETWGGELVNPGAGSPTK